jgi:hypothetical protein
MARYYVYVNNANQTASGRYSNRYYQGEHYNARGVFLTDTERPLSAEEQREVASSDHFKKLFGSVYFVFPQSKGIVISNDTNFLTCLPDAAQKDDFVHVFGNGQIHTLSLYDRYNNCFELVKQVMGCDACPKKGVTCLSMQLKIPAQVVKSKADSLVVETRKKIDTIREEKQFHPIKDFVYISPHLTTLADFVEPIRGLEAHDFSIIEDRKAEKRARSVEGAETRAFAREFCVRCPVEDNCTDQARCIGPYPLDPQQTLAVLPRWMERYNDPLQNPFKPWQFWAIAHTCGFENPKWKPDNVKGARPRRVLFEGMVWQHNHGFRAKARYCRIDTSLAFVSGDYEYLTRWYKELPKTYTEAKKRGIHQPPKNQDILAIWFELLVQDHRTRQSSGWGWHVRREVNVRGITTAHDGSESVHVGYAYNDKWNTANGYGSTMKCWGDFWDDFDKLPLSKTTVRPTFRQRRDDKKLSRITQIPATSPLSDQTEDSSS